MLTREAILAARSARPTVEVDVPEFGGAIRLRAMSAGELERFAKRQQTDPLTDFRARLTAACACDEEGKLIFTDADVPALSELSSTAFAPIVEAALSINKMRDEDAEAIRKNSESGQS